MSAEGGSGGGGTGFGMNAEPLHAAGNAIVGMKGQATTAKTGFLSALDDGAAAVHYGRLASALRTYRTTWAKPARQLPTAVESVGNRIKATAVDGVQTDAQSCQDVNYAPVTGLYSPYNPGYVNPLLRRPITAP